MSPDLSSAKPASPGPVPVQKGLEGVVASDTKISDVDGAKCELSYRGYSIDELVGKASYEEVAYLLLNGALPSVSELADWNRELADRRPLEAELLQTMERLPFSDPMAYLRTVVSIMGLRDPHAEDLTRLRTQSLDLIAKFPTVVALFDRLRSRRAMLGPRPDLGHAANFLYMLHGEEPSPDAVAALDAYFVLLAEHSFNASTFSARTSMGTQTDAYSAITAAVGTLKGPLHGAANAKAMEMLNEIGSVDQVEPFVKKTLADHKRFMGFCHRVCKGEDPRAKHLKRYAEALAATDDPKWLRISERLQQAVWDAKKLAINVDFYSASLLHSLGIPTDLFTPLFACARISGWCAHVLEQAADNRLIRPLAHYVGPRGLRFVPLDQRAT